MSLRSGSLFSTPKLLAVGALAWLAIVTASGRQRPAPAAEVGSMPGDHAAPAAALEPGRGRTARAPSDIPVRGWRDIFMRTYQQTTEDRITTVAAGITFFGLLALFPAVTALVSLYGLFADPATVRDHLFALSFMLPGGAFQIVEDQISRIIAQGSGELTFKLVLGLGIALWGANAGMKAIIDGLNVAYEETEKRGFIALNALSLALTLAALVAVLLAAFTVTLAPAAIAALDLPRSMSVVLIVLRWVVMAGLLTLGLSVLYRFAPSREAAKWRWVTWGGAFAAILWIAISLGLSAYLTNFADYNATYGSLGAAVALMMWIWLSACAILVGAELNSEMEHQTAVDSTTGPPVPMGMRQATMADTLGRSAP
jgi:membrane protein